MSKSPKKQAAGNKLSTKDFIAISNKFQKIFDDLEGKPKKIGIRKRVLKNRQAFHDLYQQNKNDINARDDSGNTLLHYAINIGSKDAVATLIARGADVNCINNLNQTPLHFAAIEDKPEIAQILIDNNANINAQTKEGYTVIDLADISSKVHKVLGDAGARTRSEINDQKLDIASRNLPTQAELEAELAAMDADLSKKASKSAKAKTSPLLKRAKVQADAKAVEPVIPSSPLAVEPAAKNNAQIPVSGQPDVNIPASPKAVPKTPRASEPAAPIDVKTQLNVAIEQENLKQVQDLLNAGADPNIKGNNNITPLHMAAKSGNAEIINVLLNQGANPNSKNNAGQTPLDFAAIARKDDAMKALVLGGASVQIEDAATKRYVKGARLDELKELEAQAKTRADANIPPPPALEIPPIPPVPELEIPTNPAQPNVATPPPPALEIPPLSPVPELEIPTNPAQPNVATPPPPPALEIPPLPPVPELEIPTNPVQPNVVIPPAPNAVPLVSTSQAATSAANGAPAQESSYASPPSVQQQQYALFATTAPGVFVQLPVITPAQYRQNLNNDMDKFLATEKEKFFNIHKQKNPAIKEFKNISPKDREQFEIYEKGQVARKENLLQQNFLQEEMITNPGRREFLQQKLGELQQIQIKRDNEYYASVDRAKGGGVPYPPEADDRMSKLQYDQNPLIFEGHIDTVKGSVKRTALDHKMIGEIKAMAGQGAEVRTREGAVNAQVVFDNPKDAQEFLKKMSDVHKINGRDERGKRFYHNTETPTKFVVYITPGEVQNVNKSMAAGNSFAQRKGRDDTPLEAKTEELGKEAGPGVAEVQAPAKPQTLIPDERQPEPAVHQPPAAAPAQNPLASPQNELHPSSSHSSSVNMAVGHMKENFVPLGSTPLNSDVPTPSSTPGVAGPGTGKGSTIV